MKIDSGASYLFVNHTKAVNSVSATEKDQPSGGMTASAGGIKQADFSSMTRQDLRDWTNNQIRSGQMTLDESTPFMAMTMKIPVGGNGTEISAATDNERIDFMAKAKLGVEAALQRNDQDSAKRLQMALGVMLNNQGQAIGVDIQV